MRLRMQLRSAHDDLIIYQPYQSPVEGSTETALRFLKVANPHLPRPSPEAVDAVDLEKKGGPLRAIQDIGGHSTVFLPGTSPSFILKSASSPPRVIDLKSKVVHNLSGFHGSECQKGFVFIDEEVRSVSLGPMSQA